jgi:hypothetical protein
VINEDNAEDIYDGLKSLKGSALSSADAKHGQKFFAPMLKSFHYRNFQFRHIRAIGLKTFKIILAKQIF